MLTMQCVINLVWFSLHFSEKSFFYKGFPKSCHYDKIKCTAYIDIRDTLRDYKATKLQALFGFQVQSEDGH